MEEGKFQEEELETEETGVEETEMAETYIKETEEEKNKEEARARRKSVIREIMIDILIVVACVIIIPRYIVQRTIVSGSSMEETLQNEDNLLVEKVSYLLGNPKRFDVVVFYPYGKDHEEYYVKRVIGLPGETIQIIGEDIYVDGELLEENYGKDPISFQGIAGEALTLGEEEYFLMGDNREVSFDSRYREVGPVNKELIAGKAILRIWPLNSFGFFDD